MKTKVLAITALLFGGLVFTSCQKDNAFLEDNAIEQSIVKENCVQFETEYPFLNRMFDNYPDPFANSTTIHYQLLQSGFVQLDVYKSGSKKRILLVKEYQKSGVHKVKFDASRLAAGKYIAELKVGKRVYTNTMIKMNWVDDDSNSMIDD
ncbi:MAG: hypothetical protein C0591_12510 [Marinilabiliales bacterium]|nr:MAG: hypothetical protein C0591_12510 [Marinilabiliales bacterium]